MPVRPPVAPMLARLVCELPEGEFVCMNSNKAAGPVARVFRDAMLPAVLKLTANSAALRQTFDHHIDWDAAVPVQA